MSLLCHPKTAAKAAKVWHDTSIQTKPEVVQEESKPAFRKIVANCSAYTKSSDECGKGDGITASGVRGVAGRTIAMDGVPFGTRVEIKGHIYIVEDRFGGGYTDRIDIFMDSKAEAMRFGRQYLEVIIYDE